MSHARLAPSNHRWPHCPGSVREEANYPDKTGEAAIDGTGTHVLIETCFNTGINPHEFSGITLGSGHHDKPKGWRIEPERIFRANFLFSYINRRKKELGEPIAILSEHQSNPGRFFNRDDWYGTADVVIIWENIIEVIDYKDGKMHVDEKNNSQFISYGSGVLLEQIAKGSQSVIQNVRLTVVQPKTMKPVRYVDMTAEELLTETNKLAEAAKLTDDPEAPLIVGKWCTWCKHGRSGNCTAKTQVAGEGIKTMTNITGGSDLMESLTSGQVSPKTLTNDQIADILDALPLIKKLGEGVEEEALTRIENGQEIPRHGVGYGRSTKKWKEEPEIIEKKLRGLRVKKGDIYPVSLISPAQALKLECLNDKQLKKVEGLFEIVPGKKRVVRSNITKPSVEEMFKVEQNKFGF